MYKNELLSLQKDVLGHVRTVEERAITHSELEVAEQALYLNDPQKIQNLLEEEIRYSSSIFIKKLLSDKTDSSRGRAQTILRELAQFIEHLPVIHLDIAIQPTSETTAVLSHWLRTSVNKQILIEYGLDRTLLGGARIIYKGKYTEINMARILDTYLQKERAHIEKLLR